MNNTGISSMKIFTLYDAKVGVYLLPFYLRNKGEAIRSIQQAYKKGESMIAQNPSDFTLFEIGQWDDEKGYMGIYEAKVPIGTVQELVQ